MSTPKYDSTSKLTQSCKTIATSTPIKGNPEPMDIDIESSTSEPDDFSSILNSAAMSLNQLTSSDESSELIQNQSRCIPNVGKDWDYFKPMDSCSLYYVILNSWDFIGDVAHRWLNFWKTDTRDAMIDMLQFFLDVAGYQNFKISTVYGTKKFNEKILLQVFKDECGPILENYTYLLRTNSEWSRSFKTSIYQFLQDIVLLSDKRPTYNYLMLTEMFEFIKLMAQSEVRAVKHTAVVFALKFLLALSKLHKQYQDEIAKYMSKSNVTIDFDILQSYKKRHNILMKFMKDLFISVSENCCYHDEEMEEMQRESLITLYKMLNYTFEFYIKSLEVFKQFLYNPYNKIRLATLVIIRKIIENSKFYPHLKGNSAPIFRIVIDHRFDVDFEVAVESINVFTISVERYKGEIPCDILNSLYKMVYNKFYPIGSASGKFLYAMISNSHEGEISRIKAISEFSQLPEMKHLLPLLVESLMDCAAELHSYGVILDMLLLGQKVTQDKMKLLEILCHTIIQTVTGKSIILRKNYREGVINHKQVEIIFNMVLPKFEDLFNKYCDETGGVKNLLQMLLVFPYNDQFIDIHKLSILGILECLSKYFSKTNECEVLDMISEVFSKTCSIYCPLKMHCAKMLRTICKCTIDSYKQICENKDSWKEEDIEVVLLQLQSLFKHHKMSLNWNINEVQTMFSEITHLNEKLLLYNLTCSYEYEKSVFRNAFAIILSNENQRREDFENLRSKCDQFLEACYSYLLDGTSKIIMDKAFECLCDFYIEIANHVYKYEDTHPHIMALKKILGPDHKKILLLYVKEHIFNNAVSDSTGLKTFMKLGQCIMKRGLPLSVLPHIFSYYNKFYTKYGTMFEQILNNISLIDANTVGIIVSTTLIYEFAQINTKDLNDDNQQYIELKKLALMLVRSISPPLQVAALRFAINFAFIEEDNLVFLLCLEGVCNEIHPTKKSFILDVVMQQKNYNIFQGNEYTLRFIDFLTMTKRKIIETVQVGPKRTMYTRSTSFDSDASSDRQVTGGPSRRGKKKTRTVRTSYASLITDTTDRQETGEFD